jgi:hypothetical protein
MDLMCSQIDWTTSLGAAFTANQSAVLDAVQRMLSSGPRTWGTSGPRR